MAVRRPVFWFAACFVFGIFLQSRSMLWLCLALSAGALFLLKGFFQKQGIVWPLLFLALVLGLGYAERRWQQLPQPLPAELDNETVLLQGRVVGFPRRLQEGWQIELEELVLGDEALQPLPGRLRLSLYDPVYGAGGDERAGEAEGNVVWQPGDLLRVEARIRAFGPGRNFGDPDWALLFRRRGIIAFINCETTQAQLQERSTGNNLQLVLWRIRQAVFAVYQGPQQSWLQREWAELLASLTIGCNDERFEAWDNAFRQAGIIHLLVVSGGHFALLLALLRRFLRWLPISLRAEQAWLAVIAVAYVLLTGAQDSIMRAGIMALLALTAEMLHRRTEWPSLLMLSMLIQLLIDPFALFESGFQLSYLSVAGLCLWTPLFATWLRRRFLPARISRILAATLAAQLATLPLSLQLFNQFSFVAPLSNLLCAVLVAPLQLLALLLLILQPFGVVAAAPIAMLLQQLLSLLLHIATISSSVPFMFWNLPSPGWPLVSVCYLWLLVFTFAPRRMLSLRCKARIGLGLLCLALLFTLHPWPRPLEIVMIDVGQGDGFFLRLPNGRSILIDGGGAASYRSQVGLKTVLPFLRRQGLQRLDLGIISHPHEDHYQGLIQLSEYLPIDLVVGPEIAQFGGLPADLRSWLEGAPTAYRALRKGDCLELDEQVRIEVRSVGRLEDGADFSAVNDSSIVLRLQYGRTVLWLTGDAETAIEEQLLREGIDETGSAVVLKIAHHGGRGGNSSEWLRALKPQAALISVGVNNHYGHPSSEVIERLGEQNTLVLRSDQLGAVRLLSDGRSWSWQSVLNPSE